MKITTKKIIRELESRNYTIYDSDKMLVTEVRNIIDEILKQHKNITIR
jgi:hypothetical protein